MQESVSTAARPEPEASSPRELQPERQSLTRRPDAARDNGQLEVDVYSNSNERSQPSLCLDEGKRRLKGRRSPNISPVNVRYDANAVTTSATDSLEEGEGMQSRPSAWTPGAAVDGVSKRCSAVSVDAEAPLSQTNLPADRDAEVMGLAVPHSSTTRLDVPSIHTIIARRTAGTGRLPGRPSQRAASSPPSTSPPLRPQSVVPSINDIVGRYDEALRGAGATPRRSLLDCRVCGPQGDRAEDDGDSSPTRSSEELLERDVMRALFPADPTLHHARSLPAVLPTRATPTRTLSHGAHALAPTTSANLASNATAAHASPLQLPLQGGIAAYLRSPRLTRILLLRRPPNTGLAVSLADVGHANGHPVLVFLGLGCVRFLVALYDDLAQALGLRLICVDRWGLGRTTAVPSERRGFLEWTTVLEEVADALDLPRFSLLAHSAGAPYALATSLKLSTRVTGSIHLLAPWVPSEAKSSYRWLRMVPNGVIRTAQAAEWRVQGWRVGKPPTTRLEGVGFDLKAPVRSAQTATPSMVAPAQIDSYEAASGGSQASALRHPVPSPSADQGQLGKLGRALNRQRRRSQQEGSRGSPTQSSATFESSASPIVSERETLSASAPPSIASSTAPASASTLMAIHSIDSAALGRALLSASHAESLKGGTDDLLTLLERNNKPMGFAYEECQTPVKVWAATRDQRIPLAAIQKLQSSMPHCRVTIVDGDHDLMSNPTVLLQALESIRDEHATPSL